MKPKAEGVSVHPFYIGKIRKGRAIAAIKYNLGPQGATRKVDADERAAANKRRKAAKK